MVRLLAMLVLLFSAWQVQAEEMRRIEVQVSVDKAVQSGMKPEWPVYIYAAAPGSRIPLASTKLNVSDLPATVLLTEEMYVLPQFTLKGISQVELVAKVSTTGDPHKKGPEDRSGRSAVIEIAPGSLAKGTVVVNTRGRK